jgi:transposase
VQVDETGFYERGKRHWLQVAGTQQPTYYTGHAQRGGKALAASAGFLSVIGILPVFTGTAVHDAWAAYKQYGCQSALCNAHHLRELKGVEERDGQPWAAALASLLREIKLTVEQGHPSPLSHIELEDFEARYEELIQQGLQANPALAVKTKVRPKEVPVVRPKEVPVVQKISGCFRGEGARYFCRIRGYISTIRKQNINVLEALTSVFRGQPLMPDLQS